MATISSLSPQSSIYSIISSLTLLARQPITRLESKRTNLQTMNSVYSDLKSKLSALRSAADDIADEHQRRSAQEESKPAVAALGAGA